MAVDVTGKDNPAQRDAVLAAVGAIREDPAAPHLLADLAASGFYSQFHFHRIFARHTGTTPGRFLTALRMEEAKRLLAHTSETVMSISDRVGYQSLGSFTTQFTRLVGISPGRFRELVDDLAGYRVAEPDLERARAAESRTLGCELRLPAGEASGPPLDDRVSFVGLFNADLPQGGLSGFGIVQGAAGRLVEQRPASGRSEMFLVSLPSDSLLVGLAVGGQAGTLVGRGRTAGRDGAPAELTLRRPDPLDPPVVSAAPAVHLRPFLAGAARRR
ncbi:helix-turn-helix transcriptional regulator [Nocardiopsis changdeensis]|uniref:Helix-turn-helix transcriptional regulator n=1 Tax=Nocardiopsis changdeensis TaxID=2831969 RepID=A0ABX8BS04_9ACTN|nr:MULTISPECIES: AraC family transcriptional regulator [Nocardiopsis]QUX24836.1 helix-turn-helix transcriptional regulator [Nocardiopsis changdeensis]QYX35222.1 AraC family transcriptional regulator [Nocardiopsis sp. MT53]